MKQFSGVGIGRRQAGGSGIMGMAQRIEGGGERDRDVVARAVWRRAALRWTDPQSGESLNVELSGPAEWIESLRSQGFEAISDLPVLDPGSVAGGRAGFEPPR